MRTTTLSKRPWTAVAGVLAAVAIIVAVAHQGNATANTGPPNTPANPLAHLIVPDGEDPRVRISWDADTSATGYTITRGDGHQFESPSQATTYSDHTVEPGEAYSYTVTAANAQGSSAASETAAASVPPAPSTPGDFAGSVADPSAADEHPTVSLSWTASTVPAAAACATSYPLDDYVITRNNGDDSVEVATPDSSDTSFTDDTAAFGTTYTYRIAARSAIGSSTAAETTVVIPARPVEPATGVTASIADPFDGAISLSWNAPAVGPDVAGYQVLRDDAVLVDNQDGTSYSDDTAEAGVLYSYAVKTRSADNISAASSTASIEAPAPPSGMAATAGNEAVELSWSAPAAGTVVGYRIERQTNGEEWASLADTTATSHSDSSATSNVEYRYRVQHRNAHGGSTWTESNSVTLIAKPGPPTGVAATVDGNDNVITWTAPADSVVDGYRVRHRTGDGAWTTIADAATATSHRHTDTQADVTHHYGAQAYNSAGDGPWSDDATTMRITPPVAPTTVTATVDGDDIVVSWERPSTVHIDGYTIGHRIGDQTDYTTSPQMAGTETSYRMADVTGDVNYHIAVMTHNRAGNSPWSDETTAMRRLAPSAPTNVTATAGDANITVSWEAPQTGTADGYRVRYGENGSDSVTTADIVGDTTSFTHDNPTEGTEYAYQVQAHNTAGDSPWTQAVTATRLLTPGVPTDVAAAVSGSVIVVTWNAPASSVVDAYHVRYGVESSDVTEDASVAGDATEFVHEDPTGDTRYQYVVRARNDAGNSAWSQPVTAMRVIPPLTPTGLSAAIDGNDIRVSWTAPATGIIDSYQVELRQSGHAQWSRHDVSAPNTTYIHAGPTPGATYEYRARSVNPGGASDWTEAVTAVWHQGAAPPVMSKPSPLGKRLIIRWLPSVSEGVTKYQLRTRVDGGDWSATDISTEATLHFDSWSADQDLREYSMRALIDDVAGDWSPIQRVVITAPTAVTNVRANREGSNFVRIHWDIPEEGRPNLFIIETKGELSDFFQVGAVTGYETTYRSLHQDYGATHQYRIRAQNHVRIRGPVGDDATVSVTMPAAPAQYPDAVSRLEIRMEDGNTPKLTWRAPERHADRIAGYRVYRKLASDTRPIGYWDHVLVRRTGGTSFTDRTAKPGVAYEYAVAPYRRLTPALGPISYAVPVTTW